MRTQSILPPVSWLFAVACCLYFLFAYGALAKVIPVFGALFNGLGVSLPLPTRLLMATYSWLLPLLAFGAVILTFAKQFFQLDKLQLRIINLILIAIGIVFIPLAIFLLYLPYFVLTLKLLWAR